MAKEFTLVSMKRGKKDVEIQVRDDSTKKETKIVLSNIKISDPNDVLGVYDSPESGQEKEAKGKDGRTYWVRIASGEDSREDLPPGQLVLRHEADMAERTGRYEDAAKANENLVKFWGEDEKLLDKAKMLRAKAHDRGSMKIVSVDVNVLIQQLKQGGLVTAYRCPNCGGNLKISGDTKPESLNFCSYCGSKIETLDLADFLKSVL